MRLRRTRRRWLPTLAAAMLISVGGMGGVANAYWSGDGSGSGLGGTATVQAGDTPQATAAGDEVTVTWALTTWSIGLAVDGYTVHRYDAATLTSQTVGSECAGVLGVVPASPCTESGVPAGEWVYTITPRVGSSWTGAESEPSAAVLVTPGPLAAAAAFSVLGGSGGVTSTGLTTVSGDLGTSPSLAVVGFPPGLVAGTIHAGDATAAQAQTDLALAYADAAGRTPTTEFDGDLNGRTFHAGVHHTAAAMALTGTLTLDGEDDPDAVFIFQVGAALNTAAASQVVLVNGAQPGNVYWQVLGASGIGGTATFAGTIMSVGAITIGEGATLIGRALTPAMVTLATNTIRFTVAPPPTITITGGGGAVTKDTTPTIAGTTNAAAGRTVTVTLADPREGPDQVLTTVVQGDGTWSVTAADLAASIYPVVASVRDAAGNNGTASQTLTVEVNPAPVDIRTTAPFSVLAGQVGVINTGATIVSGDLGVSPGTAIAGFPPGIVAGATHAGDATAAQAQTDLALAYADAAGRAPHTEFAGDLNGHTFHAGVHHTAAAVALTGTLTLDGEGDPDAVFIVQVDAALDTAAASQVVLVNGAQAGNVYWQVVGATGIGANATFVGTILSADPTTPGAITIGAGAVLIGRALSHSSVTLATNSIRFTSALPPTITITGGSSAVTKGATATIAGTTSAAAGRTVTVTLADPRGGLDQVLTTLVQPGGTWSVTAADLAAGAYPVVASVRDAAGNAGTASQELTVEVNPDPVDLRSAAPFSVLAGAVGVTSTGLTTVSGDLGTSPGALIVGFPPGIVAGTIHADDPAADQAQADLALAYADAAGRAPHTEFAGDLNGRTFHAGVHHTAAAVALTGTLTLDGEGDPDAVFIVQVDAALDTAAASHVTLVNAAQAGNVYWQVQGATGIGANATFVGTILSADTTTPGAITIGAGAVLIGRALSQASVSLASNSIRFVP